MNKSFDAIKYFHSLAQQNKLALKNDFFPCTCSGIASLEDVLTNFQKKKAFICVEDTNDSAVQMNAGGWFNRRVFTVFIMCRYRINDMVDRENKLNTCRQIFHEFHSRMIRDRELMCDELAYLNVENVASREIGQYFVNGLTGLYFMIDLVEPIDLCYVKESWV